MAEEYLADHFPTFPVMPGVLMLHALVESGAWLLRASEEFRHSIIALREARNVKYGNLVEPGKSLVLSVEVAEVDAVSATFKGKGEVEGNSTVSARFTVTRYNLQDRNPAMKAIDTQLQEQLRARYALLSTGLPVAALQPA
jgi:3-hydroxyacyl-[acyl-carrier-protein] dehydratase